MVSGILQFLYFTMSFLFFIAFSVHRKMLIHRIALVLGTGTLVVHSFYLISRSWQAGRLPLTNMFETLHLLAFLVTFLFFIGRLWRINDLVGGFAGLISAILIASSAIASPEIEPLLPALKSNWLLFHVTSCFVAYSSFALAMATAFAYLWIDFSGFFHIQIKEKENLLEKLAGMTCRLILFGYPFLTLGIATGSVWAELSWGRYWNWDPKETWAFATWIIYGAYLHLQYIKGVGHRLTSVLAILAFGVVIFTYYGVNFWLATMHDYM